MSALLHFIQLKIGSESIWWCRLLTEDPDERLGAKGAAEVGFMIQSVLFFLTQPFLTILYVSLLALKLSSITYCDHLEEISVVFGYCD